MSLVGSGTGGAYQALNGTWNGDDDLSVFLWVKSTGTPAIASRIFGLYQARSRGFLIFNGSSYVSGSTNLSICIVAGSGADTQWGNSSSHAGRGMAHVAGALSGGGWVPVCAVIRGSGAPDNTGSGNAQQIHSLHVGGVAGTVGSTTSGIPPSAIGSRALLLARDNAANYFSGKIAQLTVWKGYRLTEADCTALEAGADPRTIEPSAIIYYRPLLTDDTGVVWPGTLTAVGDGTTVDALDNPPTSGEAEQPTNIVCPMWVSSPVVARTIPVTPSDSAMVTGATSPAIAVTMPATPSSAVLSMALSSPIVEEKPKEYPANIAMAFRVSSPIVHRSGGVAPASVAVQVCVSAPSVRMVAPVQPSSVAVAVNVDAPAVTPHGTIPPPERIYYACERQLIYSAKCRGERIHTTAPRDRTHKARML